ncbi:MAG TPA: LysM domain-containing protein [Chthoniobacterales bacterium]|nr:LysM domain-containing protein [Chthoniobacterales bacterium]
MKIIKKPSKQTPKKRLRTTGQRAVAKYSNEDCGADEPNVKLSRAFVVVLLLHVVAVGGIFAFSALKDRQTATVTGKGATNGQRPSLAQGAQTGGAVKPIPSEVQNLVDSSHTSGSGAGKPQAGGTGQENTGESAIVYVVQRGDRPAGIAKKFKISYESLLKTNNIDDPKKLHIGQKLLIPTVNR